MKYHMKYIYMNHKNPIILNMIRTILSTKIWDSQNAETNGTQHDNVVGVLKVIQQSFVGKVTVDDTKNLF